MPLGRCQLPGRNGPCIRLAVERLCFVHGLYDLEVCERHLIEFPAAALDIAGPEPVDPRMVR